jgi:ribosomal-protein-alanine N-acetyltransferase
MRFIDGPKTKSESIVQLQHWIEAYERAGYGFMTIRHKLDNKIISNSGFLPQTLDNKAYIELGYCLDKAYWQQGYATEVASALIEYGFSVLKFTELIAIIRKDNLASIQVAKKIGMHLSKTTVIDNHFCHIFHQVRNKGGYDAK